MAWCICYIPTYRFVLPPLLLRNSNYGRYVWRRQFARLSLIPYRAVRIVILQRFPTETRAKRKVIPICWWEMLSLTLWISINGIRKTGMNLFLEELLRKWYGRVEIDVIFIPRFLLRWIVDNFNSVCQKVWSFLDERGRARATAPLFFEKRTPDIAEESYWVCRIAFQIIM